MWRRKEDKTRFLVARDGDNLVFPFQCDLCWFRNLEKRSPKKTSISDEMALVFIRRVNLDGMWARSKSTVGSVRRSTVEMIESWLSTGFTPVLPKLGPWPIDDNVGFRLAIAQLHKSLKSGRNRQSHQQFDTIRKQRTAYSHLHEVSSDAVLNFVNSFRSQEGRVYSNSNSPTQSLLYTRFNYGLLLRMGRQTIQNMALDYLILKLIMKDLEQTITDPSISENKKRWLIMVGGYLVTGFVLALRSNEVFMVEAGGLVYYINDGKQDIESSILIPLLGRFKNEAGERWHFMLSVSETASGFQIRKWLERIVTILNQENKMEGPAFCYKDGSVIKSPDIDNEFHSLLERIQENRPDLIKPNVNIRESYAIFRSLRRGCTTRTAELNIPDHVVDLHNRWRTKENKHYASSLNNMRALYTDLALTRKVRLQFTRDL